MSNDAASPIQVRFTLEYQRNLRQLAKKYRHIRNDLTPVIDEIAKGNKPGDQIPNVGYEVFKIRAKNSDARKGKSGGYRLIYFVKSESERVLITVYSKTEQSDISADEIRRSIAEFAAETSTSESQEPERGNHMKEC